MTAGRKVDRDGIRMAKSMAADGYTNAAIASVLGVSKTTVWRWVTDDGENPRGRQHLRRLHRVDIQRLRNRKFTFKEIGEVVGCTAVTARKIFYGLPTGGGR